MLFPIMYILKGCISFLLLKINILNPFPTKTTFYTHRKYKEKGLSGKINTGIQM